MNRGRPLGPIRRFLLRPIGWPILALALLATAAILFTSRPPLHWPSRYFVDLLYYLEFQARTGRVLTWGDRLFVYGLYAWLAILGLCFLRAAAGLATRWRSGAPLTGSRKLWRLAAMMLLMLVSTAAAAVCWPSRLAQHWAAAVYAENGLWPNQLDAPVGTWKMPIGLVDPQYVLDHDDELAILESALRQLPRRRDRTIALKQLASTAGSANVIARTAAIEKDPVFLAAELRILGYLAKGSNTELLQRRLQHTDPDVRSAVADAVASRPLPHYRYPGTDTCLPTDPPIVLTSGWSDPNEPSRWWCFPNDPDELDAMAGYPSWPNPFLASFRPVMAEGPTVHEREAAARALLHLPAGPDSVRFLRCTLWTRNPGLSTAMRPEGVIGRLPSFVHFATDPLLRHAPVGRISTSPSQQPTLLPVPPFIARTIIRIAATQPTSVCLCIERGSPWQAYPRPDALVVQPTCGTTLPRADPWPTHLQPPMRWPGDFVRQYPWLVPASPPPGGVMVGVCWQSLIVSPSRLSWMDTRKLDDNPGERWWSAQRNTPGAWVCSRGESERFIYLSEGGHYFLSSFRTQVDGSRVTLQVVPAQHDFVRDRLPAQACLFVQRSGGSIGTHLFTAAKATNLSLAVDTSRLKTGQSQATAALIGLLTAAALDPGNHKSVLDAWADELLGQGSRFVLLLIDEAVDYYQELKVHPRGPVTNVGLLAIEVE